MPRRRTTDIHGQIRLIILALGLPAPEPEHRFHPVRRWRFDYAWPDHHIALEYDGGTWAGKPGHTYGKGHERDCEKINEAQLLGWQVFRCNVTMVEDGRLLDTLQRAFALDT